MPVPGQVGAQVPSSATPSESRSRSAFCACLLLLLPLLVVVVVVRARQPRGDCSAGWIRRAQP